MDVGIYKITKIKTKQVYIGQSINVDIRLKNHLSLLNRNKHNNKYLQNSFNKYKAESFTFEPLLRCNVKDLDFYEIRAIKAFKSDIAKYGFNVTSGGDGFFIRWEAKKAKYKEEKRLKEKELRQKAVDKFMKNRPCTY